MALRPLKTLLGLFLRLATQVDGFHGSLSTTHQRYCCNYGTNDLLKGILFWYNYDSIIASDMKNAYSCTQKGTSGMRMTMLT